MSPRMAMTASRICVVGGGGAGRRGSARAEADRREQHGAEDERASDHVFVMAPSSSPVSPRVRDGSTAPDVRGPAPADTIRPGRRGACGRRASR